MANSKPVLGYWYTRGFGQPIRLLLTYLEIDFVDKRYSDFEEWFEKDKLSLELDFPNLPYFIDGKIKLTQTLTILRYLGNKYNLSGSTIEEQNAISMVEQQIKDMSTTIVDIAYDEKCEELKPDYIKQLPNELELLSNFLQNRKFVIGDSISYVDFWLYEFLTKISVLVPEVKLSVKFPNLGQFMERIESLPQIVGYIKKLKPALFHGDMAYWNGKK